MESGRGSVGTVGSDDGATLVPTTLLDSLVAYFRPRQIILFGSRARGTADKDSDIDLLVVIDDDAPKEKLTLKAGFEAASSYPGATDIVPCRLSTYRARADIVGTLCNTAAREGIIVYER
jgi:uncharacterized protein